MRPFCSPCRRVEQHLLLAVWEGGRKREGEDIEGKGGEKREKKEEKKGREKREGCDRELEEEELKVREN